MQRPIVGHGLGSSREANFNFAGGAQRAHVLYGEVATELGFVGLAIYLVFIYSILHSYTRTYRKLKDDASVSRFRLAATAAMQVWLWMNVLFSVATYGLTSYEWYLFAALSVVSERLAREEIQPPEPRANRGAVRSLAPR